MKGDKRCRIFQDAEVELNFDVCAVTKIAHAVAIRRWHSNGCTAFNLVNSKNDSVCPFEVETTTLNTTTNYLEEGFVNPNQY